LFGSRSWHEGVSLTGRNRTINRQKFDLAALESELKEEASLRHSVFRHYAQLLRARNSSSAFHPHGRQQVLDGGPTIFALLRLSPDGSQRVVCLHNISCQSQPVMINWSDISDFSSDRFTDLITNTSIDDPVNGKFALKPYQTLWLRITA
jgi:sucrose phosphorylase